MNNNEHFSKKSEENKENSIEKPLSTAEQAVILATEIISRKEVFPFPGMKESSYKKTKESDEECPGWTTPIDEIIERMKTEGMKVVFGKDPSSGNIYILPVGSDNIEEDSILDRALFADNVTDVTLKKLISLYDSN